MKNLLALILGSLLFLSAASAQEGYTVRRDSLQSAVLGQNRHLNIYLPEGYDTTNLKYPVIYVLDADGRDQHIVPTARFLFLNHRMPRVIIVGVMNIDRNHDFLPDSSQNAPTGGGADNFMRFFSGELIPYVEKNLRTESYKVLIGHSYGGLFALYSLLKDPGLFDAYIAIDPSVWYKNLSFLKYAAKEFPESKDWRRTIFITGRDSSGMKEMGIAPLEKLMKESAPADLNWKITAYPDEDHGSVPFKSAYDGLRYIFDSGSSLQAYPVTGIIPAGMPFNVYFMNLSADLRYTTDGSEPGPDSPHCLPKTELPGPCTLKIRSVTRKYNNFPTAVYVYKKGDFLHGLKSVENLKPGLKYEYFEGSFDSLPDFSRLKRIRSGIAETLGLGMAARKDSFALRFDGYLHIEQQALYYLWILSDDGSRMYLNNNLIMDNNGIHSADLPKMIALPLTPGYYPITVEYFEKSGNESVSAGILKWDDDLSPAPLAREVLFHKEGKTR